MTRWNVLPLASVVLTAVAAVAITSFWKDWSNAYKQPATPLLANLGGWAEGNHVFRQRLLARVPLGSPEVKLLQTLKAEGFSRGWEPTGAAERSATIQWSDFACNIGAPVTWRVDQADRVVAITTAYHEEGCM